MDPSGPTQAEASDPFAAWAAVRAAARPTASIQIVADEPNRPTIAWPDDGHALVLDQFTRSVWEQLDGQVSVADLVAELLDGGFPPHLDALAVVATAVDVLVTAGLATMDPSSAGAIPEERRRTIPGSAVGGHRWIHERPLMTPDRGGSGHPAGRLPTGAPIRWRFGRSVIELTADEPELATWAHRLASSFPADEGGPAVRLDVTATQPRGFDIIVEGAHGDWSGGEDLIPRVASAVVVAARVMPPGSVANLGSGWVSWGAASPAGRPSVPRHHWVASRHVAATGDLIVPLPAAHRRWVEDGHTTSDLWQREHLTALSLPRVGSDRAETLAELADNARAHDRRLALHMLAGLVERVDDGPPPSRNEPGAPAAGQLPPGLRWAAALLALGEVGSVGQSVKIRASTVEADRWLAWMTPATGARSSAIRAAVSTLGLPDQETHAIATAIESGHQIAVGTDGGPSGGRKVYVQAPADAWWQSLRGTPTFDSTGGASAEVWTPTLAAGTQPLLVAWKWGPDGSRIGTYWYTLQRDFRAVFVNHPAWAEALGAFPVAPASSPHLVLVEATGRHSLDLLLDRPTWGAALDPLLRRLAAVAALDATRTTHLLETVGPQRVVRVIGGLDAHEGPLATLYLGEWPLPTTRAPSS